MTVAKTDKSDEKLLEKYAEFIAKNDGVKECIILQKQEGLKEIRAINAIQEVTVVRIRSQAKLEDVQKNG